LLFILYMLHIPQHPFVLTLKSTKYEDSQLADIPYLTSLCMSHIQISFKQSPTAFVIS
jgi:hypothetical protein